MNVKKQLKEVSSIHKRLSEIFKKQEMWLGDLDNQRENIKKRWKEILKTAEEQKNLGRRLNNLQTSLEKTGGFNTFSLTCPYCSKKEFFNATDQEINQKISEALKNIIHPECRIENEQRKNIVLRPILCSGELSIQSGFSPVIQYGKETIMVDSNIEPVVQSGSPIIQFADEVKTVESSGGPILHSGFSAS